MNKLLETFCGARWGGVQSRFATMIHVLGTGEVSVLKSRYRHRLVNTPILIYTRCTFSGKIPFLIISGLQFDFALHQGGMPVKYTSPIVHVYVPKSGSRYTLSVYWLRGLSMTPSMWTLKLVSSVTCHFSLDIGISTMQTLLNSWGRAAFQNPCHISASPRSMVHSWWVARVPKITLRK